MTRERKIYDAAFKIKAVELKKAIELGYTESDSLLKETYK